MSFELQQGSLHLKQKAWKYILLQNIMTNSKDIN